MEKIKAGLVILLILQLLWVCYTDIKLRTISNKIISVICVTIITLCILNNKNINIYLSLLFLLIGFFIFLSGTIGGADIKLISVLTLALTYSQAYDFLIYTSIAGGIVIAVGMLISPFDIKKRGVPYGVAISAGFLLVILI